MLKLPFIERTGVGIEITKDKVYWIETDKLGGSISYASNGEATHNGGEASLKGALETLKTKIKAEAYIVGVSIPEALLEVVVEEIPYSEEEQEVQRWINEKIALLEGSFEDQQVLIQYHIIELDEDSKRCIFQVLDEEMRNRYNSILFDVELYSTFASSGLLELGYSQSYHPEFLEGTSSVVQSINQKSYLTIFNQGQIQNVYELGEDITRETEVLIRESDSYLQTEEASTDLPINSIPVFITHRNKIPEYGQERKLFELTPFEGKKSFQVVSSQYTSVSGVVAKLFYPGLDSFNFSSPFVINKGVITNDKKESIRLSILLFVPLIFFGLLTYAFGKVVDYRLVESNQIMEQIGDKIEEVTSKRTQLLRSRDRFMEAKNMLQGKEPTAYVFELIGETIPAEVWLQRLSFVGTEKGKEQQTRIYGYANSDNALSSFLSGLEQSGSVEKAGLIVSEKIEEQGANRSGVNDALIGSIRFELLVTLGQ